MVCTNCGASNETDAKFCINCGKSVGERSHDVSLFKKVEFLQVLLNFSLNQFISPKMMKLLYSLSILSAGLIAFLFVLVGFNVSRSFGILTLLIGAPLIFLLGVIYSRVLLEIILVIFRIADHTANIGEESESKDAIQWKI